MVSLHGGHGVSTTYAVLNICNHTVVATVATSTNHTRVETTSYSALDGGDNGGWAPLPRDARQLPWAGPLHPSHTMEDIAFVDSTDTAPRVMRPWNVSALSFTLYTLS
eukprot:m.13816 g.13816  ORF g.13816 m.13816 type:complete len:108 (+) comp10207_c0_seq2:1667-1990(+)